jgi:hypothetical protein
MEIGIGAINDLEGKAEVLVVAKGAWNYPVYEFNSPNNESKAPS